ncbi:MAG: pphA 1 [Planctomycetaceae bacterium]|nr:pphA 1 [Planctomycetaceae bacterium]
MSGRILALGDIHGCNTALDTLLGQLQLVADDSVVVLGDIVDRGPGTRQVIERLLELQQYCQLQFVKGNHEQMLLGALDGTYPESNWLMFGGREVLDSYGETLEKLPSEHLEFLRSAVDYYETPTEVFVHASLEPGVPLSEQHEKWLRWTRYTGNELPLPSGQRVVCGHTPQASGLPARSRGWACIDTCAYGNGWLTCLDVLTDEFYQADEQGRYRTGQL